MCGRSVSKLQERFCWGLGEDWKGKSCGSVISCCWVFSPPGSLQWRLVFLIKKRYGFSRNVLWEFDGFRGERDVMMSPLGEWSQVSVGWPTINNHISLQNVLVHFYIVCFLWTCLNLFDVLRHLNRFFPFFFGFDTEQWREHWIE